MSARYLSMYLDIWLNKNVICRHLQLCVLPGSMHNIVPSTIVPLLHRTSPNMDTTYWKKILGNSATEHQPWLQDSSLCGVLLLQFMNIWMSW